jgi:hypothetical protein
MEFSMKRIPCFLLLGAIAVFLIGQSGPAPAAEWGTLSGRVVLDGEPPESQAITPTKDQFCMSVGPPNETLLVGKDGGLENVVIYIRVKRGQSLDIHPDYDEQLEQKVVLDNKGCRFVPHIALVRTGQPLVVKNSDPTGHNTNASLAKNGAFNVLIAASQSQNMTLSKAESLPLPVQCNVHPFMKGYMLVRDDPYMTVTDEDGAFEINNIPAGNHEFQFWQERIGYLKDCKYDDGQLNRRGRVKLDISGGEDLNLGKIKVPVSLIK